MQDPKLDLKPQTPQQPEAEYDFSGGTMVEGVPQPKPHIPDENEDSHLWESSY